jgi:hypothetical protein
VRHEDGDDDNDDDEHDHCNDDDDDNHDDDDDDDDDTDHDDDDDMMMMPTLPPANVPRVAGLAGRVSEEEIRRQACRVLAEKCANRFAPCRSTVRPINPDKGRLTPITVANCRYSPILPDIGGYGVEEEIRRQACRVLAEECANRFAPCRSTVRLNPDKGRHTPPESADKCRHRPMYRPIWGVEEEIRRQACRVLAEECAKRR